ncbi:MAG: VOC family protein [Deltaproteobacteria bacterium]|nr:VOC family protein [Deltaproteobacteria bacterium]MBW2143878.1 VOC family protein [Deltaproteobacteria bacterium]
MKPLGVNRVTIAVKDLEKGMDFYGKLLGATFHEATAEDVVTLGIRAALSWDAGIELVSPMPGRESFITEIIEQRGEGLIGVVFAVDDVEEAHKAAQDLGVGVWYELDYDQETIDKHLQGRFTKYKEYMLDATTSFGVGPVIGEFKTK